MREGAPVEAFAFEELGEQVAFLADNLRAVMNQEPNASVAQVLPCYEVLDRIERALGG